MARALSSPIGPALLSARPLVYLPRQLHRFLRPTASLLGRVEAVRGFAQLSCTQEGQNCWALTPPADADPAYLQSGIREITFKNRFLLPTATGRLSLDLELSLRVLQVGHLKMGNREILEIRSGRCPELCESDSIEGVFAAKVEVSLTMAGDLPQLWNRNVVTDALVFLLVPFGSSAARRILETFVVKDDGKLSFTVVLPLGAFKLIPP